MTQLRGLLLTGLMLTLAACGQAPSETPAAPVANPASTAAQEGAPAPAEPAVSRAEAPAAAPSSTAASTPGEWRFQPGRHYQVLTSAGPRSSAEPIEVVEFFWYGCPACFSFEPLVERWKPQLADDVRFIRIPVMWSADHERYARLYYTAEALGRIDEVHQQVFRDFHLDNRRLRNDADVEAFFARFGVSSEQFREAWNAFSVTSNLNNARRLGSPAGYGINSTPTVVVNGRYIANGPDLRSLEDVLAVTDELIARERQARLAEAGGG
jgi:thiol:disulfide interchange protein DsbA